MKFVFEFELPILPKTTNAGGRTHWAVKVKEIRQIKIAVRAAIGATRPEKPFSIAALTLTRYSAIRPDYDGLVSSFKHVIDSLVVAGIIENDTHDVIGVPKYLWEKAKPKQGRITVKVEGNKWHQI